MKKSTIEFKQRKKKMAIFERIKWKVIQNGKLRDIVHFPSSFDERTIKRYLILHYGFTGSFTVEKA